MLQILADDKKMIKLFIPYDEIYPNDWGFWLAEQDGYNGLSIFNTKNSVRFIRVSGTLRRLGLSKVMRLCP